MMQSALHFVRASSRAFSLTQRTHYGGPFAIGLNSYRCYATNVVMPALSPTMTEGVISRWCIDEGQSIDAGDVLFEMETDKATMEVEASSDGILAKILVPASADTKTPVNKLVAIMVEKDEDWENVEIPTEDNDETSSAAEPVAELMPKANTATLAATASTSSESGSGGHATTQSTLLPSVSQLVHKHHLNASEIPATGPKGHLLKGDVLSFLETGIKADGDATALPPASTPVPASDPTKPQGDAVYKDLPITNMRKIIGSRLLESKTTIPHTYMTIECDLSKVTSMRADLKARGVKVSVNDFVVKASAVAISEVPGVNCQLQANGDIKENDDIGISIAVATPAGLITPIVTNANGRSVANISTAIKELAGRAKEGKLQPKEFQGGSFSVSNLGMFGVSEFAAVINPPQAAIMAVGCGRKVVSKGGEFDGELILKTIEMMTCRMSYDERVIDSETMARFCDHFKSNIENPLNMI
eukprot:CFRG2007T1